MLFELHQASGDLQCNDRALRATGRNRADLLDRDPVHLADLGDQQVDEIRGGQGHDELVDRHAGAAFQDVDAHHIAVHGADPARYLPERARTVGYPDPNHVGQHGTGRYRRMLRAR